MVGNFVIFILLMTNLLPHVVHFWCEREEEYLELLHKTCLELSEVYRAQYVVASRFQNKLRLPAIILSSLSAAANFGSTSFASSTRNPQRTQGYINITIGIVNVFIATIQTYESFKKIADIVTKSISTCLTLKKLAEDIHCMVFIPPGDRETAGIMYLRDAFNRYQSIMDQAPPLEEATKDHLRFIDISNKINVEIKKQNRTFMSSQVSAASVPFVQRRNPSSDSYVSSDDRNDRTLTSSIAINIRDR